MGKEISGSFDKMYIKERKKLSVSGRDIVQDVEMFMNEKKEKPVVFVDYLQILSSCTGNRNATERQKMTRISMSSAAFPTSMIWRFL